MTLEERYKEVMERKFSGVGGISKHWHIILMQDNFFKKVLRFDTEEEATIAYAGLLRDSEMSRDDILLTIVYYQSC